MSRSCEYRQMQNRQTHPLTTASVLSRKEFAMADNKPEMIMNMQDLYREETFTDLRLGTIRKLIPVLADGSNDDSRDVRYSGQAQIMTPGGALPISFELAATNIGEAVAGFGPAAEKAVQDTVRELEEMRRQSASGIVMPGAGDVSKITGGGAGGGILQP